MASAVAVHTKGYEFALWALHEAINFFGKIGDGLKRARTGGNVGAVVAAKARPIGIAPAARSARSEFPIS